MGERLVWSGMDRGQEKVSQYKQGSRVGIGMAWISSQRSQARRTEDRKPCLSQKHTDEAQDKVHSLVLVHRSYYSDHSNSADTQTL